MSRTERYLNNINPHIREKHLKIWKRASALRKTPASNDFLPVTSENTDALKALRGGTFGCPSKSKPVNYLFDQYVHNMLIKVNSVNSRGSKATIEIDLPPGYEVRQRVEINSLGVDRTNRKEREGHLGNNYWKNIFWINEEGKKGFTVSPNNILDIIKVTNGLEIPVATIDIIKVHPQGEVIEKDRIADEDYIFADVRHATLTIHNLDPTG